MNILSVLFMFLCGACNAVPGQHSYLHEKCREYRSCAGKSKDGFRLLRRNDGMTNDFVMRNSFGETCGVARCVFKPDGTMEIPFLESGEDVLNTTSDVLPFGDIPNTALTAPTSAIAKPSITSVPKRRRSRTIMCSAGEDVQNPGERCGVIVFKGQEVRFYRNGTCLCGKVGSFDFESREEREALAAFSVPSVFEENSRESLPAVSTEKGDVERKSEVSETKEELGENKAEDVRSQRAQFCEEKRGDSEMQIKEKVRKKVRLRTVPGCKQGKVKEGSSGSVLQLENKNYKSLLSERGGGLPGTEVTVEKSGLLPCGCRIIRSSIILFQKPNQRLQSV